MRTTTTIIVCLPYFLKVSPADLIIGNMTFNVTIDQKTYNVSTLNTTYAYCYNGTGYDDIWIQDNTRCMPNTDHPTYQWGFSTMLSAVFVILQFSWAISMYIVWQDAQWNSSLVKS